MSILKQTINRREFLRKMGSQLLAAMIGPPFFKGLILPDAVNATNQGVPYGSGSYGQGSYYGSPYQIYCPIVSKEGN